MSLVDRYLALFRDPGMGERESAKVGLWKSSGKTPLRSTANGESHGGP